MKLRQALKKGKKIIIIWFILLMALAISSISHAESEYPIPWMDDDGNIVFDIKSTAASSNTNIRYRTVGYTISMKKQENMVTAKGIQGPDAPPTPYGYISLSKANKEELIRTKEYVITRFTIPE
ncbi:MAG: hypothetical protein GX271_01630, partial [Clostridiales bacterium]|nr:hypothetical protein [Clostridiales bacterium]